MAETMPQTDAETFEMIAGSLPDVSAAGDQILAEEAQHKSTFEEYAIPVGTIASSEAVGEGFITYHETSAGVWEKGR